MAENSLSIIQDISRSMSQSWEEIPCDLAVSKISEISNNKIEPDEAINGEQAF